MVVNRSKIMGGRAGGGARGGGGGASRRSSFTASVTILASNGTPRYLTKGGFKSESQAQDWVDKVATKFNWKNKTATADYGYVEKVTSKGKVVDIPGSGRDFGRIFEGQMAKAMGGQRLF